ncbi:MAG TPA: hypothetical protein PKV72_04805 [Candidatus Peribacteria bacterium]|nr:hypothetical protein [Candidatus Peribacteria bacterium]
MKRLSVLFCGTLLLLTIAAPVHAHALGLSLEEKVGDYLIDVGYDQALIAGEQILFDFNLYNQRRDGMQEAAEYSDVAFEVTLNGTTIFNRKVERNAAKTFMTVVFPTSGQYGLHVTYYRGEEKFVETTFSLAAANGLTRGGLTGPVDIFEIALYVVGSVVCIAAGIGLLISRVRKNGAAPQA